MIEPSSAIRRAARRLRYATLAAIALVELLILFAIWLVAAGRRADFTALRIEDQGLPPWPAALSLALIGLLVGIALIRLVRMLGKVEAGTPFGAAADLRGFAFYLFLSVLASILAPPLLHLALAAGDGEVHRIGFALGMGEGLMVLITGLLFFVARLLDEAQRLADDHSQIV